MTGTGGVTMADVKFDKTTRKWFHEHLEEQTTMCKCEKCGLYYKPSLGHKCRAK